VEDRWRDRAGDAAGADADRAVARDAADRGEQVVLVDWLHTVPIGEAFHEPGLFGNQNSACKLRDQRTIDRVSEHFGIATDEPA
jgi:hypothetical protein